MQAGTRSWKAFFFGSFDCVELHHRGQDPRLAVGGRDLRAGVRVLLVDAARPAGLEGVLTVGSCTSRCGAGSGPRPGSIAGLAFALTPAAALMFRFNNPDALLTLLMTASAYCVQRAVERGAGALRWLLLAGLLLGFAFLAKMLQAFLVLPGFALAYLVAAPARLPRRIWHVLASGLAVIAGAGWWVAIAQLWPAGSRPVLRRVDEQQHPRAGPRLQRARAARRRRRPGRSGSTAAPWAAAAAVRAVGGFGGATGIFRLFQSEFGGQVSWLIPAALISLAALVWVARPRAWRPAARVPAPGRERRRR